MNGSGHRYRTARLVDCYGTVLFPFDALAFVAALERHDYVLVQELAQAGLGAQRIEVSGVVARRGDVGVYLNTERYSIGVVSASPEILVEEIESLHTVVRDDLDADPLAALRYCEFVASLTARAYANPLEMGHGHFAAHPLVQRISATLGSPVAPYGVRLGSARQNPNQTDWTELKIEPLAPVAASTYIVEAIFRRSERNDVLTFVRGFDATVDAVLRALGEA
jgi:hypothetical protein